MVNRRYIKFSLEHVRRNQCLNARRLVLMAPALTTSDASFAHQTASHITSDTMPFGF
ncbi:hypothetical protein CF150_20181 [Pseudomonas sp. CF150]|nr:hypothetical protein CF150_20181 [Pseudomonas sp. CF150]